MAEQVLIRHAVAGSREELLARKEALGKLDSVEAAVKAVVAKFGKIDVLINNVGTKAEIYRLLAELLKKGAGIIMISSYLPEVYELADTLHVSYFG